MNRPPPTPLYAVKRRCSGCGLYKSPFEGTRATRTYFVCLDCLKPKEKQTA